MREWRSYNEGVKSFLLALIAILAAAAQAAAQDPNEIRRLFEAGQYTQVVEATPPEAEPVVVYTAAQSHQKLSSVGFVVVHGRAFR